MRLLITTDTVGGVWTFTQQLTAGLLERGCHVRLVSFGRAPSDWQRAQCDALSRRCPGTFAFLSSEIALEWMDANERVLEDGSRLLMREIALFQPDLVHCNQFCFGVLNSAQPRVITAHSDVLSWAKACRAAPLASSCWLKRYAAMVQAGLLGADAVAAPTRWMLEALAESFAVPNFAKVIPNGRSVEPATDAGRSRALHAVTAGRLWDEAKGIDLLAEVESPVPIAVAGEMCDAPPAEWQRLRWRGELGEDGMMELLRGSSIYLCLSKYEPFGLAALEGALCGCAVVARDIPPLREVWAESALYFRDAGGLEAILRMFYEDRAMLRRARASALQRSQLFTRDRMVDGYMDLFQRTLQGC